MNLYSSNSYGGRGVLVTRIFGVLPFPKTDKTRDNVSVTDLITDRVLSTSYLQLGGGFSPPSYLTPPPTPIGRRETFLVRDTPGTESSD